LVGMRRLFWRSLHPHSESKDLRHRLVSFLLLYYNISVLILFLASRGSYVSKIAKESVKPLRTQQKHAHDQRAKDTQVARLKTPIIVPSFKQKKLQFGIIKGPINIPRDMQLRKEQRLKDKDDGTNELLMDALIRNTCGDNEALDIRMTYQEVLNDVDIKLAQIKDSYTPYIVADLHLLRQYTQQLLKPGQY